MSKTNFIILRVLGILLIIGLLAGGAYGAYHFGYVQGVAQSPAIAEAMQSWQKSAGSVPLERGFGAPMMYAFGYHPHMGFGRSSFFPFGGLFGFLFVALLFFGLLRLVFCSHWDHRAHWHKYTNSQCEAPPWTQGQPTQQASPQPETPPSENN